MKVRVMKVRVMKVICINCGGPLKDEAAFFDCLLPMPKVKTVRYGRCGPCQEVGRTQADTRFNAGWRAS